MNDTYIRQVVTKWQKEMHDMLQGDIATMYKKIEPSFSMNLKKGLRN